MNPKNEDKIFSEIQDFLETLIPDLAQLASVSFFNLTEDIKKRVEGLKRLNPSTMERLIKTAWNLEEKHCSEYSLEEAIKWIKLNKPSEATGGILLKMSPSDKDIVLHHCFIDKDQNPLLDGKHPHRIVYTREISEDLSRQFGEKDMLVFK
ncbi:MAG: hypothetical protein VKL42_16315 [Snowella sp.]|nr:hypothetical protein [Snowella sp.]